MSRSSADGAHDAAERKRVTILQEYVAEYRVAFFESLVAQCANLGIDLEIAAGTPRSSQAQRGDIAQSLTTTHLKQREVQVLGRRMTFRNSARFYATSDLVVVEQARRNLDLYLALFFRKSRVALWGHGVDVVESKGRLSVQLLRRITMRAAWFFAYTEGGARSVAELGFPTKRITVLRNSTDTSALRRERDAVAESQTQRVRSQLGLTGPTALFVGALDPSKRLDFLVESASQLAARDPTFRLLVAGDGPLRREIEKAAAENQAVVYVGRAKGDRLAELASACDVIMMPGRVGLVAVDAFALGLPVVTTDWPWHAPEREYLDDSTCITTPDNVHEFAGALQSLMADRPRLYRMQKACRSQATNFSAEAMATRFATGLADALGLNKPS